MARPLKSGLDYFPFDVDFFSDEKIVAISGEFGIKGELIVVKLLCAIYKNGYYVLWNDLFKFKLLKDLPGISSDLLSSVVNRLVLWGFFDKSLFDSTGVLSSTGIQRRYFKISKRRKSVDVFRYLLISISDCENNNVFSSSDVDLPSKTINVSSNEVNVCNNLFTDDINVYKNTTKESKGKEIINISPLYPNGYISPMGYDIEDSGTETSKIKIEEKEKSSAKKEKEPNYSFDEFWNLYDKKVGKKDALIKKWLKLSDLERELAMRYIPEYKKCQPDKKFRKNPETFLNQKSWNDELIYYDGNKKLPATHRESPEGYINRPKGNDASNKRAERENLSSIAEAILLNTVTKND